MALWRMEELKVRREAVAVQEQRKAERVAQRARAQQRARERVRAETSKRAREVRAAKLDLEALKEQRKVKKLIYAQHMDNNHVWNACKLFSAVVVCFAFLSFRLYYF